MNKKHTFSLRNLLKKILTVTLPLFSTLFLVGSTAVIIIVMKGYSIDITKRELIKTGVLNIETNPDDAEIFLNNEYQGKSNKAIPNLKIGDYQILLNKEGYFSYKRQATVLHGLATPYIVSLIRDIAETTAIEANSVLFSDKTDLGYYIITKAPLPTPTVTSKTTKDPQTTVILTHVTTSKPLFDDPIVSYDEKMTLTHLTATPLTGIKASANGKYFLISFTDKSKAKAVALIPFKTGTTVHINLAANTVLTNYLQDSKSSIYWAKDPDYLIIETNSQLISYHLKTGTRIILMEKDGATSKNIWSFSKQGLFLVKTLAGTAAPTFSITLVGYNGTPVSLAVPSLTLDNEPQNIWDLSTDTATVLVLTTKKETFLLGQLYAQKSNDYVLTTASEKLNETTPITQYADSYSLIKIAAMPTTQAPLHLTLRHSIVFLSADAKEIFYYTYNHRTVDWQAKLGILSLVKSDTTMGSLSTHSTDSYVAYITGKSLRTVDITGTNSYELSADCSSYALATAQTSIFLVNSQKDIKFRVLR
jgi:hypothetical protein